MLYHCEYIDKTLRKIVTDCLPRYTGNKIKFSTENPADLGYLFMDDTRIVMYDRKSMTVSSRRLFSDFVSEHKASAGTKFRLSISIPRGSLLLILDPMFLRSYGILIYGNRDDVVQFFPKTVLGISHHEGIVLSVTAGLHPILRYKKAFEHYSISREDWDDAKSSCMDRGLLGRNGAMTARGRNAMEHAGVQPFTYPLEINALKRADTSALK